MQGHGRSFLMHDPLVYKLKPALKAGFFRVGGALPTTTVGSVIRCTVRTRAKHRHAPPGRRFLDCTLY